MSDTLLIDTLAGMTGGFASVYVGQPLDTVKVKMQLFPSMYKSMVSCLMKTARQKGLRGLYSGTLPALTSNCAENAVMFGTYGQCQKLVATLNGGANKNTADLSYLENAAAGSIASVSTSNITYGDLRSSWSTIVSSSRLIFVYLFAHRDASRP